MKIDKTNLIVSRLIANWHAQKGEHKEMFLTKSEIQNYKQCNSFLKINPIFLKSEECANA